MKKIAFVTIASAFLLAGCSENEIANSTETLLESSSEIKSVKEKEITTENLDLTSSMLSAIGVKDGKSTIEDSERYLEFYEQVESMKKKTIYNIKEVNVKNSGKNADVLLDISYIDIGDLTSSAIGDSMERSLIKVHKKETLTEESFYEELIPKLIENLNVDVQKKTHISNVEISLKKVGKNWEVDSLSDEAIKALTLNVSNGSEKILFAKKQEVETNRDFIENEKNLKQAVQVVKDEFLKRKLTPDEFYTDKKVQEVLSGKLDFKYKLTNKIGKEENFYYISVTKNKTEASVLNDGQLLTFSEENKR